jgi:N-terminal or F0 domain of Talin-head FERM
MSDCILVRVERWGGNRQIHFWTNTPPPWAFSCIFLATPYASFKTWSVIYSLQINTYLAQRHLLVYSKWPAAVREAMSKQTTDAQYGLDRLAVRGYHASSLSSTVREAWNKWKRESRSDPVLAQSRSLHATFLHRSTSLCYWGTCRHAVHVAWLTSFPSKQGVKLDANMVNLSLKVRLPEVDITKTIQINSSLLVYDACKVIRERFHESATFLGKRMCSFFTLYVTDYWDLCYDFCRVRLWIIPEWWGCTEGPLAGPQPIIGVLPSQK